MNYQLRGFRFSFIVHAAGLALIVVLNSTMVNLSKPVVIDFTVEGPSAKGDQKTPPAPKNREVKVRQPEQSRQKPLVANQETISPKTLPQQVSATSETAAESQAPVPPSSHPANIQPAAAGSSAVASVTKSEGKAVASQGQGSPADGMKQSYLREHFAYIRNIVQQKLSYPKIARQMGWGGRVVISFIVCTDGRARDITVKEGSGIEMLDKNAIVAVQNASPFPKPPVEAQLIIPIKYSLD